MKEECKFSYLKIDYNFAARLSWYRIFVTILVVVILCVFSIFNVAGIDHVNADFNI